jgi:aspartyl protease family protein
MWRFVVVLLVCVGAAPFLPGLVEGRMNNLGNAEVQPASDNQSSAERKHRISLNRHGQFIADAYLNGRAVDMLVDTGANVTALPESLAEDIGIFLQSSDFNVQINTANGITYGARAVVDGMRIGNIRLKNIDVLILKDRSLGGPLLGMSALTRLQRFDISRDTLVLVQ